MQAINRDATSALLRALIARADHRALIFEEISSRSWASATFVGARHELTFRLEGEGAAAAADRFLCKLEVAEFRLRGHILADIALVSEERFDDGLIRIAVEALTVTDL